MDSAAGVGVGCLMYNKNSRGNKSRKITTFWQNFFELALVVYLEYVTISAKEEPAYYINLIQVKRVTLKEKSYDKSGHIGLSCSVTSYARMQKLCSLHF